MFIKKGILNQSYLVAMSLGLMTALTACNEPNTFVPSVTDRFLADSGDNYAQASELRQADYVFSLDAAWSMSQYQTFIENAFLNFIDELRTEGVDYRIGFIQGNVHGNWTNQVSHVSSSFIGGPIMSGSAATLEQSVISALVDFGMPNSPNRVYVLEAARKTMAAQSASFVRPGAQLVYAFVSDNDDLSSPKTTAEYISALKSFKTNPLHVSARAIVMEGTNCVPDVGYQAVGQKIIDVAKGVDGDLTPAGRAKIVHGVCEEEFNDSLADLARNVTQATDRFSLKSIPILSTLEVRENNVLKVAGVDFNYDSATNSIVFVAGHEPAFSSALEIKFDIRYTLSKTPKAGTISVVVNNASLAQDATNGWTHNSSENRIEFHGTGKPVDGADIRVIYQVN